MSSLLTTINSLKFKGLDGDITSEEVIEESSETESEEEDDYDDVELFECEVCDFTTASKIGVKIHESKVHARERVKFDHCNKTFTTWKI